MHTMTSVSITPLTPVSLITVSQLSRSKCLKNLTQLINLQDYSNIIEWVIVEGSVNELDATTNKKRIESLNCTIPIKYIEYESGLKLSDLRNKGNNACSGDIIVVMDDDDYYPPCRVSHAVQRLQESGCQIAGTTNVYMYDYDIHMLIQFKGFGPNHATNNTMAYTRNYLTWNCHATGLRNAEEKSFTRNFNNFMVQLDPDKCVIVSSHGSNTVSKKMFTNNNMLHILKPIHKPITEFIPEHIVKLFYTTL